MEREPLNPEIESLQQAIMDNCHRSDARYADSFSLCGFLLRLRDFYKWEHRLPPWFEPDPADVLAWIEKREGLWDEIRDEELQPILWRGRELDPFESDPINNDLDQSGFYYGSGYAGFLKPSFFLARKLGEWRLDGFRVLYLDDELARDMFTAPAQTRGEDIIARLRPLTTYLWENIFHAGQWRQEALNLTLNTYDLRHTDLKQAPTTWVKRFQNMVLREMEVFVRHEFGEAKDQIFPREQWQSLIGSYPYTRIELLARTIKDLLADTGEEGRLRFIISQERTGSLGLYVAQTDGLASHLFPELRPAFEAFQKNRDWAVMEEARLKGLERAVNLTQRLLALYDQAPARDSEWFQAQVDKAFFEPLGL